jgi:hypothetical protein
MKVLLFFLFLLSLLYFTTFREGFDLPSIGASIGEYDYLKPVPTPTVLDTTTEQDFINAYSTTTSSIFPSFNPKTNGAIMPSFKKGITLEEFQYYIKNNKWPYGSYITNYITTNKDDVLTRVKPWNVKTLDDIQKIFASRSVYDICINPLESKMTPLPISNDIYTGKSQPPSTDSSVPSTSTSSLSPDNYTKLKSICSSI